MELEKLKAEMSIRVSREEDQRRKIKERLQSFIEGSTIGEKYMITFVAHASVKEEEGYPSRPLGYVLIIKREEERFIVETNTGEFEVMKIRVH